MFACSELERQPIRPSCGKSTSTLTGLTSDYNTIRKIGTCTGMDRTTRLGPHVDLDERHSAFGIRH